MKPVPLLLSAFGLLLALFAAADPLIGGPQPWAQYYDSGGRVLQRITNHEVSAPPVEPAQLAEAAPPVEVVEAPPPPAPEVVAAEAVPNAYAPSEYDSNARAPDTTRLLRRYPVRLYSSDAGPERPFRWTNTEAESVDVRVEADVNGQLSLIVNEVRTVGYFCGPGACTVVANQREDGDLVVRFKDDESSLVVLWSRGGEVQRWEGDDAPPLAPPPNVPIALDPLPVVSCAPAVECARRAATMWHARNHRYAIAYALQSGPAPTTLYTLASAFASAGEAERTAVFLGQATERERRAARRDHDFDAVREDPRVAAVIDPLSALTTP